MSSAAIYINVSYDEKEKAKSLGAKWDPQKKKWYAPDSSFVQLLEEYAEVSAGSSASPAPKSVKINKMPYGASKGYSSSSSSSSYNNNNNNYKTGGGGGNSNSKVFINKEQHQHQPVCQFEDDP